MISVILLVKIDRCFRHCVAGVSGRPGDEGSHGVQPNFKNELSRVYVDKPDPRQKTFKEMLDGPQILPTNITVDEENEAGDISGVPEEHVIRRKARIFKPSREATQTAWQNTKVWKIELDNRDRWENPNIGWGSSGDPLSSLGMHLKFGRKEDAISFCEKNGWEFEVVEPQERIIKPKSYGENFHWSKKTRIGVK